MELEAQLYFVVGLSRLYGMPPVILHSGEESEMKKGGVLPW